MWNIELEDVPFEADIRELLMAFYPENEGAHIKGTSAEDSYKFTVTFPDGTLKSVTCSKNEDRFTAKCEVKRAVYTVISEHEHRTLPWGTLTGIRPTKLALSAMNNIDPEINPELNFGINSGIKSEIDLKKVFKNVFLTSDEKIQLCFETAAREEKVLKRTDCQNGWSLYIGIPFCPTRCLYCSFTSYPIDLWQDKKKAYIEALCKEIEAVSLMMRDKKLQTIYMGGGTPTSLEAEELTAIIEKIKSCNDIRGLLEFTVEAGRPDSITEDKLRALKESGVSRISVNPQTMNQKTLDIIGRRHTVEAVTEKFLLARKLGFDNINMDIIAGLPQESVEDFAHTLDELEKLQPDDLTVHSLAIKRAARLNEEKASYARTSFEDMNAMIQMAQQRCRAMGLRPYYLYRQKNMAGNFENVGYAHEGKEGIYNILIMEEKQIIVGCGAGCTTKIPLSGGRGVKRIENVKDPLVYIDRIDEMIARKRDIKDGTY